MNRTENTISNKAECINPKKNLWKAFGMMGEPNETMDKKIELKTKN